MMPSEKGVAITRKKKVFRILELLADRLGTAEKTETAKVVRQMIAGELPGAGAVAEAMLGQSELGLRSQEISALDVVVRGESLDQYIEWKE